VENFDVGKEGETVGVPGEFPAERLDLLAEGGGSRFEFGTIVFRDRDTGLGGVRLIPR